MSTPLVSVLIPTYNRGELLRLALDSVLSQTYNNLEVMVVDDASGRETKNLLQEYQNKDNRVRVVANKNNIGFVRSLNKGLRAAKGEYIARLDDDDSWCDAEKLEKQIGFFEEHKDYALVGGGIVRVDENGKELARQLFPQDDKAIRKTMLMADPFAHPAVLFRAKDARAAGGYEETLDYAQDWDLWMKLGRFGKYYNVPEYFVRYLQASQNRSNKHMRHHLRLNLVVRKRHRSDFPGFWKGYAVGYISYLFAFIPIKYRVSPWFLVIRKLIIR